MEKKWSILEHKDNFILSIALGDVIDEDKSACVLIKFVETGDSNQTVERNKFTATLSLVDEDDNIISVSGSKPKVISGNPKEESLGYVLSRIGNAKAALKNVYYKIEVIGPTGKIDSKTNTPKKGIILSEKYSVSNLFNRLKYREDSKKKPSPLIEGHDYIAAAKKQTVEFVTYYHSDEHNILIQGGLDLNEKLILNVIRNNEPDKLKPIKIVLPFMNERVRTPNLAVFIEGDKYGILNILEVSNIRPLRRKFSPGTVFIDENGDGKYKLIGEINRSIHDQIIKNSKDRF
jgi:hypothetical protein